MTDGRRFVGCRQCDEVWPWDQAPGCSDPTHPHVQLVWHRHETELVLPGGTTVVPVSFDDADPYRRDIPPDHGLYLDGRWDPPWPHDRLHWPDFGAPADPAAFVAAMETVRERARAGSRVEVGCYGGHGRTGTALAWLAVLDGHPREDAVAWVRANYCAAAVETADQEAFVVELG